MGCKFGTCFCDELKWIATCHNDFEKKCLIIVPASPLAKYPKINNGSLTKLRYEKTPHARDAPSNRDAPLRRDASTPEKIFPLSKPNLQFNYTIMSLNTIVCLSLLFFLFPARPSRVYVKEKIFFVLYCNVASELVHSLWQERLTLDPEIIA